MRFKFLLALSLLGSLSAIAQDPYVAPKDSLVVKKLEHWQDLKFGLLMHWGTY